ncbi:DUF3995 domain-containing protein [Geodermatophilus sp. SYSU D00708]
MVRGRAVAAHGAALLAATSALVSAYWTAGGTALLATVGGGVEELARERSAAAVAVGALTVVLKLAGGALALALVRPWGRRLPGRLLRGTALLGGALLALYGGVLVLVGGLALAGVFGPLPSDPSPLRWHVALWDPWFFLWGVLLVAAALPVRRGPRPLPGPGRGEDGGSA